MGQFFETIPKHLFPWIHAQKLFWVATAPLSAVGHVNVSPKGGQYFGVIDIKTFWYMDLSGSGIETISHLYEPGNGRITIMFNAFDGPARIVRFWGKGSVFERGSAQFDNFVATNNIQTIDATRSIILVDIHQVATSCGFSVPFYDFKEYRTTLNDFFAKKAVAYEGGNEKESLDKYWAFKNALSIDNMPGMKRGVAAGQLENVAPIKKMVGSAAAALEHSQSTTTSYQWHNLLVAMAFGVVLGILISTHGLPSDLGRRLAVLAGSMIRKA